MAKKATGRAGFLIAGLGFGVAAGVALGALALAPNMPDNRAEQASQAPPSTAGPETTAPTPTAAPDETAWGPAVAADAAVGQLIPAAVEGTLVDRPVLVISTADAAAEDVEAVRWLLGAASAIDAGHVELTERFFAPEATDQLRTIIDNTLPAGVQLSAQAQDPGTRTGEALGSMLTLAPGTGQQQVSSDERAATLQSLRGAGFIDYPDGTVRPGQVIVIVTGGNDGSGDGAFAAENLAAFATALDSRGDGAVLAGRAPAAGEQGPIGLIRANENAAANVSTIDSVGLEVGRGGAVLAVSEQLAGEAGAYGAAPAAEAPLPPPA